MTLFEFFRDWQVKGDDNCCFYCGVAMLAGSNIPENHPHFRTRDHFIPKSRRKLWTIVPELLGTISVMACCACNNIKGNRTPESLRLHVKRMTGDELFFCEKLLGTPLNSIPEYLTYCRAASEFARQEHKIQTQRSLAAVEERRKAGLLPPAQHKNKRRKAMKENVWWDAMNSLGRLVWTLEQNAIHPDIAQELRDTIARIKDALPEEFQRRRMGAENAVETRDPEPQPQP